MTARAFASVLAALLAAPLAAQPATPLTPAAQRTSADGHLLEIRDGAVHLDGVALPDAVPAGLDLSGMTLALDYSGPITPVVEVDGQAYVLERRRLVRFEESARAGERVYVLGEARSETAADAAAMDASAMDDDQLAQMSEEVYMRELAERDRALYARMQHESELEASVESLATRVRRTDAGPERVRLRGELRTRLSELFTLKQQIRREEVVRAQAELGAMQALLDVRDAQHEAIVDGRLRGLVGE